MSPKETDNFNTERISVSDRRRSGSFERVRARYRDKDLAANYMKEAKPENLSASQPQDPSKEGSAPDFRSDFTGNDNSFRETIQRRRKSRISPVSTYSTELKEDSESTSKKQKRSHFSKKKKPTIDGDIDTRSVKTVSGFNQKSNKRRQVARWLLSSAFVLILLGGLSALGLFAYGKFHVKQINIIGSTVYSEEQLLALSDLQKGDLIFNYKPGNIIDCFSHVKGISVVSVKRSLPDSIFITVEDIVPYAAVPAANGSYTLISVDGKVYSIGESDSLGLLKIEGLSSEGFIGGTSIASNDSSARESAAVAIISKIVGTKLESAVTTIDLSNSSCVKLKIGSLFTIVLGNCTESADNIGTAEKAYAIFSKSHPSGGTINVFTGSTVVDFTPAATDSPQ